LFLCDESDLSNSRYFEGVKPKTKMFGGEKNVSGFLIFNQTWLKIIINIDGLMSRRGELPNKCSNELVL
jgi:hypothetical protein